MDDGKCLLDVISDPQALKEFFRSSSQIAFVEGNISPLTDETDNKPETSRSDNAVFSTCSSQSSQSSKSSTGHLNEQSKPLAHYTFPSTASQGNILANNVSSINNGLSNRTGNITTVGNSGNISISISNQHLITSKSNIQNTNSLSSAGTKHAGIASSQTTLTNSPLSFAFGDAGKARNILSTGSVSLAAADKPINASPTQSINQQPPKLTSPRLISSPQAGPNTTIRPQNVKVASLPILRPKGIVPRLQNATTLGGQNTSQITIQGNMLTQGLKTMPIKGQPQLVAIRPKLIIAQSNASGSGQNNSQASLVATSTRPKQTLQNTFTLGGKPQTQVPKQVLTVPQLKQGASVPVGKSGLAGLVQLQPKQIAPKPEQVSVAQSGKAKLTQDQAYLQLVQNLLAQSQTQFGTQGNVGHKDLKQALGQDNLTQQQKIAQQNQLKKLLQQNQLVQQALQARVQQQQQQQQLSQQQQQQQQTLRHTHTQQHNNTQTQQQQALIQMKSPPSNTNPVTATQQVKLQVPSATINAASLASQLKEAISTKQLQQFLEKNPLVAQQLKQLNMRQANLAGNTRQQNITGNKASTTPGKIVAQLQKPTATVGQLQKPIANQLQTIGIIQKTTVDQLKKPAQSVGHLQKTTLNHLQKSTATVTHLQKPVISSVAHLRKAGTTSIVTQVPKATTSVTHVTIPNPKKVITIPSTGQSTSLQKTDQKPITTQKVVIVQNSNSGGVATVSDGQAKVLLQTKEGRPILLSQEQFKQIQAQLASKNLSIQGKLVTASPVTTTATTVKPQVVVKTEAGTSKVNQKVLPATPKFQTKQEVTKSAKRPIKAVETEESKLIKRMKLTVQKDQNDVCFTDIHKPFKSQQDAITRLTPYHVYSEPMPNARMQRKANMLLDKLALQLTHKSDKMINKYRQLLLNDMERDVPSAEVVMVNRIYLADEKAALLQKKKTMLEEAKQMAQAARATQSQAKTNTGQSNPNSTETATTNQLSTISTHGLHPDTSEPIEISDDDSSPITSANSFLTHLSNTRTDFSVLNRTLEPG